MFVWVRVTFDDRFLCHQGLPVQPEMKGKELLDAITKMWELPGDRAYRVVRVHPSGMKEIELERTLQENGIRDGDPVDLEVA
ncbi:hypothetical protein [Kyrpidia tusciae]|uniref:Ubiquitin-like domain-containing protein n=1 Tax=Kyrpidia tusciae (strain DSM 2912 / NBRC 15312 / T2) TaxID=562970 RepID=D5WW69_KYRT2|nr:hypothetical protein [Kyrpidia tusciae]ADG05701.1 hypothetical protein Btus_0962 [Kyrpidia tusciae DSM 2912]MBE3552113.1 hypothetical protein [Kyrpidia tusciae]